MSHFLKEIGVNIDNKVIKVWHFIFLFKRLPIDFLFFHFDLSLTILGSNFNEMPVALKIIIDNHKRVGRNIPYSLENPLFNDTILQMHLNKLVCD